jgi:AcrR family transcriptional regulator
MAKNPEILIAASRLFAQKGFKETSTAELAAMIGAAESMIFYHYKTKAEILLAVLKEIREELIVEFARHHQGRRSANGLVLLEDTISCYFHLAGSRPETFLLLHHRFPYELACMTPARCTTCFWHPAVECWDQLTTLHRSDWLTAQWRGSFPLSVEL